MDRAAEQIIGLYRRHAAAWTAARGERLIERAWLDRFLALLGDAPHILDVGCGPGVPIARHLTARGAVVTGVDSSPEMIALFRRAVPTMEALIGDMRQLALGRTFDGLIAWDSFFHLSPDDQRRMFALFRRHLGGRGALMFTSGPTHGEAIGMLEGERLYHASLDPAEYRALLSAQGFDVIAHIVEDPACGARTVWLAQLR